MRSIVVSDPSEESPSRSVTNGVESLGSEFASSCEGGRVAEKTRMGNTAVKMERIMVMTLVMCSFGCCRPTQLVRSSGRKARWKFVHRIVGRVNRWLVTVSVSTKIGSCAYSCRDREVLAPKRRGRCIGQDAICESHSVSDITR